MEIYIYIYIYICGFSTKIYSGSSPKFIKFLVGWEDAAKGGREKTVLAFWQPLVISSHAWIIIF